MIFHNGNIGINLLRLGRTSVELWLCRRGKIPGHVHSEFDSKVMLLFGSLTGSIGKKSGVVKKCKWYKISRNVSHEATVESRWCAFVNVEKWASDNITSAAHNFETR